MEDGPNSYTPKAQLIGVDNMAEEVEGGSREYGDFPDHALRCTSRSNTIVWDPTLNI